MHSCKFKTIHLCAALVNGAIVLYYSDSDSTSCPGCCTCTSGYRRQQNDIYICIAPLAEVVRLGKYSEVYISCVAETMTN